MQSAKWVSIYFVMITWPWFTFTYSDAIYNSPNSFLLLLGRTFSLFIRYSSPIHIITSNNNNHIHITLCWLAPWNEISDIKLVPWIKSAAIILCLFHIPDFACTWAINSSLFSWSERPLIDGKYGLCIFTINLFTADVCSHTCKVRHVCTHKIHV